MAIAVPAQRNFWNKPAKRMGGLGFEICAVAVLLLMVGESTHLRAADPPLAEKPLPRTDKVKFKDDAGKTAFSLKLKDGGKLVDGKEQELARYTVNANKVKIKDQDDKVLGYVVTTGEKLKQQLVDESGLSKVPIVSIPTGIDPRRFAPVHPVIY